MNQSFDWLCKLGLGSMLVYSYNMAGCESVDGLGFNEPLT